MQTDWFFPPNHGGEESGLNDAGIQFFRTAGSLARETIQNSGDAVDPGQSGPVRVEIELLQVPLGEIPQLDRLKAVITQCRDYMHGMCAKEEERAQNGEADFARALSILSNGAIPVLRIGDYNTTGLVGDDSKPMSPWYRLIKRQGTASMHGAGGGTFGIGQRAPFAFSALRTVYYSTLSADGRASLIGKSILSTFRDVQDVPCRPVGYWGLVKPDDTGVDPITNLASMPDAFRRTSVGTDLFILGYTEEGWRQETTWAVLKHFFAAILGGRIVVDIKEPGQPALRIDAGSLVDVLDREYATATLEAKGRRAELEEIESALGTTRHFVRALQAPHGGAPICGDIDRIGDVQLYLTLSEHAPSRVAYMRRPRILVFDKRQKQLKDYAAVFVCETAEGNKALAGLEDPSHTTWDRARMKGGDKLLRDISAFVRTALKSVFDKDREEAEDIPDLARFLPEEDGGSGSATKGTAQRTSGSTKEESAEVRPVVGKLPVVRKPKPKSRPEVPVLEQEGGSTGLEEGVIGAGGGRNDGPGTGGDGGDDSGAGAGTGPGQRGAEGGKLRSLRPSDVSFRSFYDKDQKCICVVLSSRRNGIGDIVLTAVGEDSNYDLSIQTAKDADTGAGVAVTNSTLRDVMLEAGVRRRILVSLEGDQHLALSGEVQHGR